VAQSSRSPQDVQLMLDAAPEPAEPDPVELPAAALPEATALPESTELPEATALPESMALTELDDGG